ncbi:DUF2332 domain-containing protein [Micromonospora aurantiaca]|uniref:DUF2332 domain-containing protein n=1 Tax=Micromonospora aurantiaca (nom. illeg.) TaxID=47850 RepID=A0A3M9JYN5_9ACTN|nr:DUF2332 domain-containing protein [Micromonospora aurantiaca]ADL45388.1 protein of unknown function UCP012608 [Micromonospora aurantiaca ATCC 27029]AXH91503.1 DUF2332 domain-containing protein [Micromonospora aurantiaca]RNH93768.1 DUF2332 domain-containing protein [Micromonospora aurantiaca]
MSLHQKYDRHAEQTLETLSAQFMHFSEKLCRGSSELYEHLAAAASKEEGILKLALNVRGGQPAPNMYFGAVHYLLLSGTDHPLAKFYPSVSPDSYSRDYDEAFAQLQDFSRSYGDQIREIISKRTVQSNEVRRAGLILPALQEVMGRAGRFHLIDVGASAGLVMCVERFRYLYSNGAELGDPASPVVINCQLRGELEPPIGDSIPTPLSRIGLDLFPVDVADPDEAAWVRALIFADHVDRLPLFDAAAAVAKAAVLDLRAGDAGIVLPEVLSGLPDDSSPVCVLFSFVVNQAFADGRDTARAILERASLSRPVFEVTLGDFGKRSTQLLFAEYRDGVRVAEAELAFIDPHGRWMEWTDASGAVGCAAQGRPE